MISFKLQNLFKVKAEHGISEAEFKSMAELIPDFLKKIESRKQGFYNCIDNQDLLKQIESYALEIAGKFEKIAVLGIGGSALGTLCLEQSLKGLFASENRQTQSGEAEGDYSVQEPKLYVLDNIDPDLMVEFESVIDYAKTLFIVVTKSGGTPETLAQYFYFQKKLTERNLKLQDHFVFITDPQKGLLRKIATAENIKSFEVPPDVGGRFSVLTAVGLLPARLIGIDIAALIEGAKKMRENFLNNDFEVNLPFRLAVIQYLLYQKGKSINVLMPYAQKLIRFADWYRQLLAESIGKAINDRGEKVDIGITPVNALGATDQHSQSQLYNEGPNDKLIIFVGVKERKNDPLIPQEYLKDESVEFLKGVSFGQLLQTEMAGSMLALTMNDRPNLLIEIENLDEFTLGELLMLFEASIAFLGEFLGINAFDQPGVELSKNLTKQLLLERS